MLKAILLLIFSPKISLAITAEQKIVPPVISGYRTLAGIVSAAFSCI